MNAQPRNNATSPYRGEVGAKRRVGGSRHDLRRRQLVTPARKLRRTMTDAERKLWARLRRDQLEGLSFRRQYPIGNYIVDFWCSGARLAIELDGGQHGKVEEIAKDALRTRELEKRGIMVLRFWNTDVFKNIEGVLAAIRQEIIASKSPNQPPTLTLPPAGGGKSQEVDR